MSYEVANGDELLGQFASSLGYADLIEACSQDTTLHMFFQHGATEEPAKMAAALRAFAKNTPKTDIAETANTLAGLIEDQPIAVITNGTD